MVTVRVKKLAKSSSNSKHLSAELVSIPAANLLAEAIAKELRNRVKEFN